MPQFSVQVGRDPAGYYWSSPPGDPESYLEGNSYDAFRASLRKSVQLVTLYDPFEQETALYRIFAALEPTQDAILKFANEFGDIISPGEVRRGKCSSFAQWKRDISKFRELLSEADRLFPPLKKRKPRVSDEVQNYASKLIDYKTRLGTFKGRDNLGICLVPDNLIEVLKLQLAYALLDGNIYRNCDFCNRPYEVTPTRSRKDRIFCSDNCRVKAYQHRRRDALQLREAGFSIKEIAARTNSEFKTVRRWVKATKEGED